MYRTRTYNSYVDTESIGGGMKFLFSYVCIYAPACKRDPHITLDRLRCTMTAIKIKMRSVTVIAVRTRFAPFRFERNNVRQRRLKSSVRLRHAIGPENLM